MYPQSIKKQKEWANREGQSMAKEARPYGRTTGTYITWICIGFISACHGHMYVFSG